MTEPTTTAPATQMKVAGESASAEAPTVTETAPSPAAEVSPKPEPAAVVDSKPTQTMLEEEPQNALTKKFTEAEWTALKEFRTQLPEIFAKAYHPDDLDAKSDPIKLWSVTIDPYAPNQDARVSVLLVKFLRARDLKVQEAHTMLVGTLRWRDEYKVDKIREEKFPKDVFGKLGYLFGHDKLGQPVTYNLYGAITDMKAVFGDIPRFIRWRIGLMEESIELLDFENHDQMIQVHDYDGVSLSHRDANQKAAAAEASNIFQNHYPEFLSRKFFINVPTLLTWMFWLFKPLLSANTFAKMNVVGHGKSTISAALLPFIEEDQLPARYGGKAEDFA